MKKVLFQLTVCAAFLSNALAQTPSQVHYEHILDSMEVLAKSLQPGRMNAAAQKAAINAEVPKPKGEYEKQYVYDERVTAFEKAKPQRVAKIDADLQTEEKRVIESLNSIIKSNADIQPEWTGMLSYDANVETYSERYEKFKKRIQAMKNKIGAINGLMAVLALEPATIEHFAKKNENYISRLERACELMQNYISREQSRILVTEKSKTKMAFGAYDPESEMFQVSLSDTASKSVPFSYSGTLIIAPELAQEINRKSDNFTASVHYINYPFAAGKDKLYLGAKQINIFYKDVAVPNQGAFKNISRYEKMKGYAEWAARADSLASGKIVPKNLDSLYAIYGTQAKEAPVAAPIVAPAAVPVVVAVAPPAAASAVAPIVAPVAAPIAAPEAAPAAATVAPPVVAAPVAAPSDASSVASKAASDAAISAEKTDSQQKVFWTNKNIFRVAMIGLSAVSLSAAMWHNREAASHSDKANVSIAEARSHAQNSDIDGFNQASAAYDNSMDEFRNSEKLRNIYFVGAGAFGSAAIVSFFF